MRFRFTIRDLLWLMVVVGLAVGWWNNIRLIEVRHEDDSRAAISTILVLKKQLAESQVQAVMNARIARMRLQREVVPETSASQP
jgi:hypothetical protein